MPSLEIKLNTHEEHITYKPEILVDYLKNKRLNLDMLEDYISIVANIQKIENGKEYHYNYKMKYCKDEMFTRFGVEAPNNV